MKILIIFTFILNLSTFASLRNARKADEQGKLLTTAVELYKSNYHFSAARYLQDYMKRGHKLNAKYDNIITRLIIMTGTRTFSYFDESELSKHELPSLNFILGTKKFNNRDYKGAVKYLSKVSQNHYFYPEVAFTLGASNSFLSNYKSSLKYYDVCIGAIDKRLSSLKKDKVKRYFQTIKELCLVNKARAFYKKKDYAKAIEVYEKFPKRSYIWPYTILENAWAHFQTGNYNRSLGAVVTYKSPLLKSYFLPEAEYLQALSYSRLCLWNDTNIVIKQYYDKYKKKSNGLKKVLLKNKKSQKYFIDLALNPEKLEKTNDNYTKEVMTQIQKQVKFSLMLKNYRRLEDEVASLKKWSRRKRFYKKIRNRLNYEKQKRSFYFNHYVKKEMFHFINEMHKFSYHLFNVHLDTLSSKRDLVYENKKLISNRARGDFDNVIRSKKQKVWDFRGAFWADELGDYSFGLKSNCELKENSK